MSPVYIAHEQDTLVVRFERPGEDVQEHRVGGGRDAMADELGMLLAQRLRSSRHKGCADG